MLRITAGGVCHISSCVPKSVSFLCSAWFRTSASSQQQQVESFPLQPGGLLHILCTDPATSVNVRNEPGIEEAVTLQVQQQGAVVAGRASPSSSSSSPNGRFLMQLLPGNRIVEAVEQATSTSSTSVSASDAPKQQQQQQHQQQQYGSPVVLAASIPSRFCGLSVSAAGGSVAVGQLQEADMLLTTSGGAVEVARARASNASINTANREAATAEHQQQQAAAHEPEAGSRGGSIKVGELSASRVSVYSGGGPVSIKRLFGLTIDVLTAGGPLSIASLYADRAAISTARRPAPPAGKNTAAAAGAAATAAGGGGALQVNHMACLRGEARLESGGAPLTVEGLEGNAALLSSGGNIKVHLHEHAGLVYVDSGGGDVEAWISPSGPPLGLQVSAEGGLMLDPQLKVTGDISPTTLVGLTAGSGSSSGSSSSGVQASAKVQQAVADARKSAGTSGDGHMNLACNNSSSSDSTVDASRLKRSSAEMAGWSQQSGAAATVSTQQPEEKGCGSCDCSRASSPAATRQLIISAGRGSVKLLAMGWMDGIKARMQAKAGRSVVD